MSTRLPEERVGEIQKVVLYSRIGTSTNHEEDNARFAYQEKSMLKFCDEHNLSVKSTHREVAPGTLDLWSRPILESALEELKWSRKEKSVLLVSSADRLSKSSYLSCSIRSKYYPTFLVAATGMRVNNLITQIQIACAEEEFRLKYGDVYRTSERGFKEFCRRHRGRVDLCLRNGMSIKDIADESEKYGLPLPYEWHWDEETILKIIHLTDKP